MPSALVKVKPPYGLERSIAVAASFTPAGDQPAGLLRVAIRVGPRAVRIDVAQANASALRASFADGADREAVKAAVAWIVCADLDLKPFYRVALRHEKLGPIARRFWGVKPLRPPRLFDMAVTAITEQQISLAAAHAIRTRLIQRFGTKANECFAFPEPHVIAGATLQQLRACGLSRAKADYIRTLARSVAEGRLDLAAIAQMPDEEAKEALRKVRGFGPWSAEYVLVRGMARPDRVPFDDLGVRTAVGRYLGSGMRVSASRAERLLAPFAPYRGLAAFYLLANHRLRTSAPRERKQIGK